MLPFIPVAVDQQWRLAAKGRDDRGEEMIWRDEGQDPFLERNRVLQ